MAKKKENKKKELKVAKKATDAKEILSEKEKIEQQFDDYIKLLRKIKKRVIKYMDKHSAIPAHADIVPVKLLSTIKEQNAENEQLSSTLQYSNESIEKLQAEIVRLTTENTNLKNELSEANIMLNEKACDSCIKSGTSENEKDFSKEKKQMIEQINELNQLFVGYKNNYEETRVKLMESRDKCNKLEADLNAAKIVIDKLQKSKKNADLNDSEIAKLLSCTLVVLYDYITGIQYIAGLKDDVDSLEKIIVYKTYKDTFNNLLTNLHMTCTEIEDVTEILGDVLRATGYLTYNMYGHEVLSTEIMNECISYTKPDGTSGKHCGYLNHLIECFKKNIKDN